MKTVYNGLVIVSFMNRYQGEYLAMMEHAISRF